MGIIVQTTSRIAIIRTAIYGREKDRIRGFCEQRAHRSIQPAITIQIIKNEDVRFTDQLTETS